MNATIDLEDIQGYVIRGYRRMLFSRNILLHVTDASLAKVWLKNASGIVTIGIHHPTADASIETCFNLAFTPWGLSAIGLDDANLQNFTREFREGMTTPHRRRLLGDEGVNAPEEWIWGGPGKEVVHVMVMIFAADKDKLLEYYETVRESFTGQGLREIISLDCQRLEDGREHFGFRDGMGQPVIAGSGRKGSPDDVIATGEFILGYKNEYGVYPDTPLIAMDQGDLNLLPGDAAGSGSKDLGRNGTYLVFRQIQQNVETFWTFMNERTRTAEGNPDLEASKTLASKMIGRWPGGAPLTKFPDKDPEVITDDDEYSYAELDPKGLRCPFGSHIRRVNPRDNFEDNKPEESLRLSKRHRILRRGKLYGNPHFGSAANYKTEGEVGQMFICFNADISRQFEFIQYTWASYPKFKDLYNDPDPIIGFGNPLAEEITQNFTIQHEPVSQCVSGLQRFTQIRGGAYFFFPSLTAIRYLASL